LSSVALLCSGATLPDKIFKEDIIVRVNKTVKLKDKRCDIWFFGDGYDYRPYIEKMNAKRTVGYSHCTSSGWYEQYPSEYFKHLKQELNGYQPCIGTMALYWLLKQGYSVNVYGMDFMRSGYFDGREGIKERICEPHNFDIEEDFVVNKLKGDFKMVNSKTVKKISNKAILEPKEYKMVDIIKCKSCETEIEYKGVPRGCPVCNTING